jgi:gamma-glutamyltranspeptidase
VGEIFVQRNLAATLRELVAVEKKMLDRRASRQAALEAVSDHFYRGPLGTALLRRRSRRRVD